MILRSIPTGIFGEIHHTIMLEYNFWKGVSTSLVSTPLPDLATQSISFAALAPTVLLMVFSNASQQYRTCAMVQDHNLVGCATVDGWGLASGALRGFLIATCVFA